MELAFQDALNPCCRLHAKIKHRLIFVPIPNKILM